MTPVLQPIYTFKLFENRNIGTQAIVHRPPFPGRLFELYNKLRQPGSFPTRF